MNLLGEGVTWRTRIKKLLEFNCGGCHSGEDANASLDLPDGDVYTRLLGASTQQPGLNLIEPGNPEDSYIWRKLIGDESIRGSAMPYSPVLGWRPLSSSELSDIETWIREGAQEDQ
ncbi:MAG: mono/diheme cytochrome c family protein [Myxococcota bacterium]